MPLIVGMLSLCALVFGATLAQLGLVTPLWGLAISAASLPLSLISVVGSLHRAHRTGTLVALFSSFAAWPAPVVLGPPVVRRCLIHFGVRPVATGPIRVAAAPDEVFLAAIEEIKSQKDWHITRIDRMRREISAIAMTGVFQFRHEFVVRIRKRDKDCVVELTHRGAPQKYDFAGAAEHRAQFFAGLRKRLNSNISL